MKATGTMKAAALWAAAGVVAIAGLVAGGVSRPRSPQVNAAAASSRQLRTARFTVERMTCATCPLTVRAAMASVLGVTTVKVELSASSAVVSFDPAVATVDQIALASANAGYPAHFTP